MNIEISARHFDLTDALENHVKKKLKTLKKFYDGIMDVHVILEVNAGIDRVHIQVRGKHVKLDAKAEAHDIYLAFDDAYDNIEHQVRKFKDKKHNHRKSHSQVDDTLSLYVPAEESEYDKPVFIDDTQVFPKLGTEEAIMKFEMEPSNDFIFQNEETGRLSVVYVSVTGKTQVVELVRKQK